MYWLICWLLLCVAVDTASTSSSLGNVTLSHLWKQNDTCSEVHGVPSSLKCKFVRNVTDCQPDGGLINYFVFTHCWMPNNLIPLSAFIMFLWLLYLFVFLGATAEDYFCPALKVMSDNLRLNQNLAGVTLLALGNGAPDIFGAYAAITQAKQGDAGLAIGAIFGAGIFVTTVVVGCVVFSFSFTLTRRPFLRDIIFYIIAVFCSFYAIWDQRMYWWEGAGFIIIYVIYVLVVFLGRLVFQKLLKTKLGGSDMPRVSASPEGKELGESEESPSPYRRSVFSPNMDSDYHSLSNAPISPGLSSRGFPVLQEETEGSCDQDDQHNPSSHDQNQQNLAYDKDNQQNPLSDINYDQDDQWTSDQDDQQTSPQDAIVSPNFNSPTFDLSFDQGNQDIESQQSIDHNMLDQTQSTDNEFADNITGDSPDVAPVTVSPQAHHFRNIRRTMSGALEVYGAVGVSVVARSSPHMHRRHSPDVPNQKSSESTPLLLRRFTNIKKKEHPAMKMLKGLSPIDDNFKHERLWWKIVIIIKVPISILLSATTPLVDDSEKDHCWNKWLNICHCVISPCFIVLITKVGLIKVGGVLPLVVIPVAVGLLAALLVALTSSNNHPPRYHFLFAWLGFAVAIVWIYSLANEIVNMLQALGVIVNLTHAVLGLTLLAWGNSIGDAISNYTMAKQGFPRMAIGACFGGPLLNMLIGIGVASVSKAIKSGGHFRIDFTDVEFICITFLLLSLLFSLVTVTLVLRFKMHKLYGVCLITLYICFMITALLTGTKVLTFNQKINSK